jgi:hypothetical protein
VVIDLHSESCKTLKLNSNGFLGSSSCRLTTIRLIICMCLELFCVVIVEGCRSLTHCSCILGNPLFCMQAKIASQLLSECSAHEGKGDCCLPPNRNIGGQA